MFSFVTGAGIGAIALVLVYALIDRLTRPSLPMIRGPKSPSSIFGHLLELFQRPVGEADFLWQSLYGNVVRFKGIFGENQLLIADPKALHAILKTSAYQYLKQPSLRVISRMANGKGLLWAEGEDHKRHRRIMLAGFDGPEAREIFPIIKDCADNLALRLLEIVGSTNDQGVEINVSDWLSRAAIDAIGRVAFNVQFNSVHNDFHIVAKKYENYCCDVFSLPSSLQVFVKSATGFVPTWILERVIDYSMNSRLARVRDTKTVVTYLAEEVVRQKSGAIFQETARSRDIFSQLVKANMDVDAKHKMNDEELLAQVCTILFSGHETTSNSTSWILLELARNPTIRSTLRAEIFRTEAAIRLRGDSEFSLSDVETMPYLNAVIKEGLRFHPAVPQLPRIASKDGTLPLSQPIITESGHALNELPVPKGTRMILSVAAYNRIKEIWGEDAHEFNPNRWLDGTVEKRKSGNLGVYSNLLTFLSGTRACLGWRIALIEMQVFLVTLLSKFEFAVTDKEPRIVRNLAFVMVPMVVGEFERRGTWRERCDEGNDYNMRERRKEDDKMLRAMVEVYTSTGTIRNGDYGGM